MFDDVNFDMYGWGGPQTAPQYTEPQMTPEQIAAWQQQFWLPRIADGGYIPPEFNNAEAMASLGQTDAWNQRQQYLNAQGMERIANLQDLQADKRNGGIAAQTFALAGMGLGTLGGIFGGAGAAGAGGAATTFPMAGAGGQISVSPLAGAGGAGGAGAAGMGGILDSSGAVIPGTEAIAGGGGGVFNHMLSGMNGNWGSLIGGLLGAVDANNQPDSMTSTYGPDPALTGGGNDVLAQLRAIFANGGPGVAGADPASLAAIQGLQGFASGNNINPYLDTVFNAGADATRNRLTSEFARSGRNIEASMPARSQDLQYLAADVYGRGHEAERQRQFSSLLPLLGGGDYLRNISQQQMDQPLNNAMRYSGGLNSLLPLFPGQNTQPLFNNPWAGFLGGAQLGSMLGGGG